MIKIYKLELSNAMRVQILCKQLVRPLTVQSQHGKPCFWFEVDVEEREQLSYVPGAGEEPNNETIHSCELRYEVVGTGHDVPPGHRYVGTFQECGGSLIFHVYVPRGTFADEDTDFDATKRTHPL